MDYFFRKTISRVPLCAAHRALSFAYIACVHFINHAFIYIYIYIIYIYRSFCLFYFTVSKIELLIIFSGKRSREFRCALRTERCRLHTSPACTLNYCIYVYILYISFCLFYFTVSKIELLIIFFPENDLASSAVRCAPSAVVCIRRQIYIYIYIYVCVCVSVMQFICIRYL